MLDRAIITHAVEMQEKSYRLLKWMAEAVKNLQIRPDAVHDVSNFPEAAAHWIGRNQSSFPPDTRVASEDVAAFGAFFTTYLTNSFDLNVNHPGQQLYSPQAHCFCFSCSWLIEAPNLKTKKVSSFDKRRAENLKAKTLMQVAHEMRTEMTEEKASRLLEQNGLGEDAGLVAYGYDLLQRLKGIANGAVVLALWRGFAWTEKGSPKPKFKLSADLIMDAEQRLVFRLRK